MADDTENLNISITATDAGASATTSEVLDIVTRLEAALRASGAAGEASGGQIAEGAATADKAMQAMNVTINVGSGALQKHAESAAQDGNVLQMLAAHSLTAARGFEVLGLEADAGAVKLAGLAEVAEMLEASFAPLLIIGTIIAVISAGFESLKGGVDAAAELQGEMTSLGTAVKMQGGDWDSLSESVRQWAEVQERATGTDVNEAVASMNRLVVAGASVKDAMYEVSVSEDVAAATHKSLRDVIDLVIEAEAGRGVGLEKLDARLKPLIKNHADLSAVIAQLAKDMSGQAAAAADTYEGAAKRLHAEWDSFWRMIGESLLPWLTQLMDSFVGFGDELSRFDKGVADFTGSVARMFLDMANVAGSALDVLGSKLEQFFHMAGANDHAKMAGAGLASALSALGVDAKGAGNAFGSAWNAFAEDDQARGHKILNDATWQRQHMLDKHGTGLDFDPPIGNEPKAPTGTTSSDYADVAYQPEKVNAEAEAQKDLEATLKGVDDAEKGLAESVKTATSAQAQQSAQAALDAQKIIDLEDKHRILTTAIASETTEQQRLTAEHASAVAAANKAAAAVNAYGEATNTGTERTAAQTTHLNELSQAFHDASTRADELQKRLHNLTANIDTNTGALSTVDNDLAAFSSKSTEAAASAARAWEEYQKKTATALAEDLATANMTNAQKVKYYGDALVKMEALDKQYATQHAAAMATLLAAEKSGDAERIRAAVAALEQIDAALVANEHAMEQVDSQYTDAYKAQIKEREDAQKKSLEQIQSIEQTFIDDIVQKHDSLHNLLKNIWDEIYDDFVKMIEQMIVKSALFGQINKEIQGIFGGLTGGAAGAGPSAAGGNAYTAALGGGSSGVIDIGAVAGQSILGNDGVPINLAQVGGQTVLPSATSSAGAGGSIAGIAGASDLGGLLTILGASGLVGSLVGSAEGGGTHTENGAIGGIVGGAGALGGMIAALGGLGGIGLAGLLSNPIGLGILGAGVIGGSLLGGLFGNNDNNSTDEPDVYEPTYGTGQTYGQFVADENGNPGEFNGTWIQPQNQYNIGLGGTSESAQTMAELQTIAQEGAAAPPALQSIADKLDNLANGDTNSNALGIASEKQGVFTLNSGEQISVQSYMQLMSQFQNDVGGTSASATPVYSISQLYPNYNQIGNPQLTGTQATTTTATGTETTFTPVSPSAGSSTSTMPSLGNVTINIPGGMVISPDTVDSVALAISQALNRLNQGLIPGSSRFGFNNGSS